MGSAHERERERERERESGDHPEEDVEEMASNI
jgi:hypothetical protein